jgi:hypothetical protein
MVAFLLACKLPTSSASDHHGGGSDTSTQVDADQDGYNAAVDCNDADASVHPGMKETCGNGVDDNCNGAGDGCPWEGENTLEGWELSGSEQDERFGSTLAVCDADGDGQPDLVVGSAGTNEDAGAVHVFYGPFGEDTAVPRVWMILGTAPSATFGSALDCHSDLTGDGAADLVIGEPDETGNTAGTLYAVPGGGAGVTAIADAYVSWWNGEYDGDRFAYGVATLDADGDGHDEIAVTALGAPGWPTQYGRTYIVGSTPKFDMNDAVYGSADQHLIGAAGNAGDMNGDGIDELAVTADVPGYPWDIALLYRSPVIGATSIDDADVEIEGNAPYVARYTQLGHADLNGDGYDDFLIGNPDDYDDAGAVSVFFGVVTEDAPLHVDLELLGRADSLTGNAIASPGDLDDDGNDELLIGAPRAGGVYLYRGGDSGRVKLDDDAQASWWAAEDASDAGVALGAGNLTADTVGDFVFGVPRAGDENKGAVVLVPSLAL